MTSRTFSGFQDPKTDSLAIRKIATLNAVFKLTDLDARITIQIKRPLGTDRNEFLYALRGFFMHFIQLNRRGHFEHWKRFGVYTHV